jgi:hypothetical protein
MKRRPLMEEFHYVKMGEIQQENDERHLPKSGWEPIPEREVGQPNMGFFEIRRKIEPKVETEKPKPKPTQKEETPEPKRRWWQLWK